MFKEVTSLLDESIPALDVKKDAKVTFKNVHFYTNSRIKYIKPV